jgi:hypothetical protein
MNKFLLENPDKHIGMDFFPLMLYRIASVYLAPPPKKKFLVPALAYFCFNFPTDVRPTDEILVVHSTHPPRNNNYVPTFGTSTNK